MSTKTRSPKSQPKKTTAKVLSPIKFSGTYSERANQYARAVVAGKVPACKWVKLACKRHLNDLERAKTAAFRFRFDEKKADRACKFIEALPHTKGKWAAKGELIVLGPWQVFVVCCLLGWLEKGTGFYRFRDALILIPRKNGKSTLAAAIALYKFCADKEFGAEVYSGATSEKQAWEVFRPARLMVKNTPALQRAFQITVAAKALARLKDGSRFEPVIGKPGDGPSPSCAVVDEYHEHPDDTLYDSMKTGMGARDNPLLLVISTAGSDRSSPCYQLQVDGQKVLQGTIENERWFVIIFTVDEGDDWKSIGAQIKANPNYGVSVKADYLADQLAAALRTARKQNTYKTKHLNVWVNAAIGWMNMAALEKCVDPTLKIEDFDARECINALDLASVSDLCSRAKMFWKDIEQVEKDGAKKVKRHYFYFGSHYLNEKRVEETSNEAYAGWASDGFLTVTPGDTTDYGWIADEVLADSKKFNIREVAHDPWQAPPLIQAIRANPDWDQSIVMLEVRQTIQNFSPAMKELEAAILDGRFHYDGDPVFTWAMSNVVCFTDAKDNIYPRKEREESKIDPAVAAIMGQGRIMNLEPEAFTSPDVFYA
jgi:phage terminase large subunit-like protein